MMLWFGVWALALAFGAAVEQEWGLAAGLWFMGTANVYVHITQQRT